jgi:ankyrin repeat protein
MSAVSAGHEAVVTTLLEAGAHVDARNSSKCTALHYAVLPFPAPFSVSLFVFLVYARCHTVTHPTTPIAVAQCSKGRPELAKLLLDKKATVNAVDKNGGTPLSRAASKGERPNENR